MNEPEVVTTPYVHETQEVEQKLLAVKEEGLVKSSSIFDLPVQTFQAGLDRRGQNRKALLDWVRANLVRGVDFDKIHVKKRSECSLGKRCKDPSHFSKDALFKPGAEKICGMLGVQVCFPNLNEYEKAAYSGVAIQNIVLRCELRDGLTGNLLAEGVGARTLAQDNGDLNKALKMTEKSGHIDTTLRLAGLSELLTQDLEDKQEEGEEDTLDSELHASVMEQEGGPIDVAELSKRAGWGDIGPHTVLEETCGCGSTMIERETKGGKKQATCELSWRAFLKQPAAVKLCKTVTEKQLKDNPKFQHTYRVK